MKLCDGKILFLISDKDMVPKPPNEMETKIHKRHRTPGTAVLQQPRHRQPSANVRRRPPLDLQLPKQGPSYAATAMDEIPKHDEHTKSNNRQN